MRRHTDGNEIEQLDNDALLDREASERREYMRLMKHEPHLGDTSYRTARVSRTLMRAWERWSKASVLARLRGLFPHGS